MTAKLQIANFLNNEYLLEVDMNQLHNEVYKSTYNKYRIFAKYL